MTKDDLYLAKRTAPRDDSEEEAHKTHRLLAFWRPARASSDATVAASRLPLHNDEELSGRMICTLRSGFRRRRFLAIVADSAR